MSTTLWLCEHNWVQRCTDCDFYPCTQMPEDSDASNDCDEFTVTIHEEEVDAWITTSTASAFS